jgi:SNF2 family DNA or RNA helicase
MTPYETVLTRHTLPFPLYPFQVETVNELAPLPKTGHYLGTGTGKTVVSTVSALYKRIQGAKQTIVIMPPILLRGWKKWLDKIPGVVTLVYKGTPAERKALKWSGDFILMSMQIFKIDYDRITQETEGKKLVIIVDEATSCKNIASGNHKAMREFSEPHDLMLLTGTPVSSPIDVYAYTKFTAPGIYRSLAQFENIHVAERDFFKKPTAWKNLELLSENLMVNSRLVLKEDVLLDLPKVTYDPVHYDLDKAHYALYRKLANEQLLPLEDGGKIDGTTANALYHMLQQIVVNYDYFADDPKCVSKSLEIIEEVLEELAGKKLMLFSNYRMTNRKLVQLLQPYGALGAFGDLSTKQQGLNIDAFIEKDKHRVICAQPSSVGYGVDGLQDVCHDVFFLEIPVIPRDFHQAVARLHREGQKHPVHVRVGVAEGTMQPRMLQSLLAKDGIVAKVQRTATDLRAAIFGE